MDCGCCLNHALIVQGDKAGSRKRLERQFCVVEVLRRHFKNDMPDFEWIFLI